jgi:hypothetical protein
MFTFKYFLFVGTIFCLMASNTHAESWATATSKNEKNGRAIFFRYIKDFQSGFDRKKQPDRVILVWRYATENGMPSLDERRSMDRLEDLLAPLIRNDGIATLAIVSTGEGWREWIMYTASSGTFIAQLNQLLRDEPRFPIDIHDGPDPMWTSYDSFRATVVE